MNVRFASGVIVAMQQHARAEQPREACGLLLGKGDTVARHWPARNVAANPETGFEIDPSALLRCYREARGSGEDVVGWYHAHPNGSAEPSRTDAARAVEDGKLWVIVTDAAVTAWRVAPDAPLHGRFVAVGIA